jgi:hypothetical protein
MPSDNVIDLPVVTSLDIPVERILNGAIEANLDTAIVIGWQEDGEFYFAGSSGDAAQTLLLLELAKRELLDNA